MRSKTELIKTASTLTAFSNKIKTAMDGMPGQTLTPEAVQDIAMEIGQVAEVAAELASEIAEGVPAESTGMENDNMMGEGQPDQINSAMDDNCKDDKKPLTAMEGEDDDEKKKMKEQMAGMKIELDNIKRASLIEKLATKYASLFPKTMREAKMNEILTSKAPMSEITTRVQEASEIIENKTMVKIAQAGDSIFDFSGNDDSEEVNIASKC